MTEQEKKTRQRKTPEQKKEEIAEKIFATGERLVNLCRIASKLGLPDPELAAMKAHLEDIHKKCMSADTKKRVPFVLKVFGPK